MSTLVDDPSNGWWNSFNDTFKVLADSYVKTKAIESGNPAAYTQYGYGAITSQNNGATMVPYSNLVQQQAPAQKNSNSGLLTIAVLGLVAFVVLKEI